MNIFTDEDIKEIVGPWGDTPIKGYTRSLFDKIEAKLREKQEVNTLRDAAQQALKAMLNCPDDISDDMFESISALKAALAEPQPEPVALPFSATYPSGAPMYSKTTFKDNGDPIMLNEDGTRSIFCDVDEGSEPQPEPVAWMVYTEGGTSAYVTDNPNDLVGAYRALPLYTAPPQRQQLTDWEAVAADQAMTIAMLRSERDALKAAAEKGTEYVLAQINQDLRAERDALLEALQYAIKQVPEFATVPGIAAAIDAARSKP